MGHSCNAEQIYLKKPVNLKNICNNIFLGIVASLYIGIFALYGNVTAYLDKM